MPQRSPTHEPPLAAIAHNIGLAHALAPTSTDDFPAGARPDRINRAPQAPCGDIANRSRAASSAAAAAMRVIYPGISLVAMV
jgi:hypothetical protein